MFFFYPYGHHPDLHSFPTRRSSDLVSMQISISSLQTHNVNRCGRSRHLARKLSLRRKRSSPNDDFYHIDRKSGSAGMPRPISYAVFCLKKKIILLVEAIAGGGSCWALAGVQ